MKCVKILRVPFLCISLLLKLLVVGHALAFTVYVDNQAPPGRDYANPGAKTGPNTNPTLPAFVNVFQPDNGGFGQGYGSPGIVYFGVTTTVGGNPTVANNFGTFGGPSDPLAVVQFTFAVQQGNHQDDTFPTDSNAPYDEFLATGYLSGTVGYEETKAAVSTTRITFTSIKNLTAEPGEQTDSVLSINPNNGVAAFYIKAMIGSSSAGIYLNAIQDIAAPGKNQLPVTGFIVVQPTATVTGRVALESVSNLAALSSGAPLGTFHVSFRTASTTTEVIGKDVTLTISAGSAFGTYSISDVPSGTYAVAIKGRKNLRVVIPSVVVPASGSIVFPDVTLPGADANNDNRADIADFGLLVNAFSGEYTAAGSGYDPSADFNFDGRNDIGDFGLLVNNFGLSGDP